MKISLNWVKQFTEINVSVDELVKKIGSQLGEIEEVIELGKAYEDVVIAKVVSCEKHPNADKLSVCLLDDGGVVKDVERKEGLVEVVCGAPNVAQDMLVAWLPPQSTVPETYYEDEPFVLEARELRGVVSNGMIASLKELGISDSHEGILEITEDARPGDNFAELYDLQDEVIVDVENKMFTHRPDCFGLLGVAREIAGIQGIAFQSPEDYLMQIDGNWKIEDSELPLTVDNKLPDLAPRFMAVAIKDIEIKESAVKIQSYLSRVGLKPINNIVDITNYYMYLTGQPLHAFDYDKVAQSSGGEPVIEIRHPRDGETIKLLNGKTISPRDEAIMIATPKQLIGVGGAMGGSETEVDANTKNIILECATFDMYSIRRTSMAHGLFTDAVTRYNKGQSPWQNDRVVNMALEAITAQAKGKVASEVIDIHGELPKNPAVEVSTEFINSRLGSDIQSEQIVKMLKNVEFAVTESSDVITVTAPFWRTDIHIPEDIIEEVGRLYGYDNLPKLLPVRTTKPQRRSDTFMFKQRLRNSLAKLGANEALTYSFVHEDLLKAAGQNPQDAYTISNALSPELQKYRLSLTPSLLANVHQNVKAGYPEFALFEIGKSHNKNYQDSENLPAEIESVAFVYARKKQGSSGAAYYTAMEYLNNLAEQLRLSFEYKSIEKNAEHSMTMHFDLDRSAAVYISGQDKWIGIVGEYKNSTTKKLKLPETTAGFEISTVDLLEHADELPVYKPLSKYPSTEIDITLAVSKNVLFMQLKNQLVAHQGSVAAKHNVDIGIAPLQAFSPDDSNSVNYSFRIWITPLTQTLESEQSVAIKDEILESISLDYKEI